MADKIASFEDYVKREGRHSTEHTPAEQSSSGETPEVHEEVKQETMEIEIEDPFQFLNEQEREEYLIRRQKEQQKELESEAGKSEETPGGEQEKERAPRRDENDAQKRESEPVPHEREDRRKLRRRDRIEKYEQYEESEDDYAEEDEDNESPDDPNMERVVRIASVMTGIVILVLLGFLFKIKVYDRFLAPDPDEEQTVVVALPAGFVETNDTVVVTGATSLNLRSGPDTSSTKVTAVAEGTELERIAVSEEGTWALIEYDGQQLYASMNYLQKE